MDAQTTPAVLTARCLPINLGTPLGLGQGVVWIWASHSIRLWTSSWIQNQPARKQNGKEEKNVFWPLHRKVLLRLLSKNFTGTNMPLGLLWSTQLQGQCLSEGRAGLPPSASSSLFLEASSSSHGQGTECSWSSLLLSVLSSYFLILILHQLLGVSPTSALPLQNPTSEGSVALLIGRFLGTFRTVKAAAGHVACAEHRWPTSKGFSETVEGLNAPVSRSPTPSKHCS